MRLDGYWGGGGAKRENLPGPKRKRATNCPKLVGPNYKHIPSARMHDTTRNDFPVVPVAPNPAWIFVCLYKCDHASAPKFLFCGKRWEFLAPISIYIYVIYNQDLVDILGGI